MEKLLQRLDTLIFPTSEDHVSENFYYATGLSKTKHVSAIFIANRKSRLIITNRLEHGLFSGRKIVVSGRRQMENVLRRNSGKEVGMDLTALSAAAFEDYKKILRGKIVDVSREMGVLRSIKGQGEIKKIREACKITEIVFEKVPQLRRRVKTERELALEMKHLAEKNGAEDAAYPPIVASGRNAALPHHSSGASKIGKGVLLIDFGVVYEGYCSDMTRTFCVGKDEKAARIYKIVYKAQQRGIAKMKAGTKANMVHRAAEAVLKKQLHAPMIHAFGHGLGIQVHDYPGAVSSKSDFKLKKNMVITAEPGYYNRTWGGVRIEDDVVVGKGALLHAPPEIPEI